MIYIYNHIKITPKSLRIDTGAPLDNQVINKKNRAKTLVITIQKSLKNHIKNIDNHLKIS